MKLLLGTILSCAIAALAQTIAIGTPAANQTLHAGQSVLVMVDRPNSLTGSAEVGIGITLHHCARTPCEDATEQLGSVLYNGAFAPVLIGSLPPHQNFTVLIPSSFSQGLAVLSVAHSTLIGAGPFFFSEIKNVTVKIV